MLNLYEIFIICHYQCQNFWEPTLKIVNTSIFIFKNKVRGKKKKKNQKFIVSNIHLNATLPICHGYYSHVVVTGFWGWFVVGALLGRRWSGRRRVRRQFWCVVRAQKTDELYVGQWEVLAFGDLYMCLSMPIFVLFFIF